MAAPAVGLRPAVRSPGTHPNRFERSVQETLNPSVVRVLEPPSVAVSVTVRRLPCASVGTTNEHRAIESSHESRILRKRFPPIHTLAWSDPGAGTNSTRATRSNGRAAWGDRGVAEMTSIRTPASAPGATGASVVAAANTSAPSVASRLIMQSRVRPSEMEFQFVASSLAMGQPSAGSPHSHPLGLKRPLARLLAGRQRRHSRPLLARTRAHARRALHTPCAGLRLGPTQPQVRLEVVSRLLGQASTATTERCYARLEDSTIRARCWRYWSPREARTKGAARERAR